MNQYKQIQLCLRSLITLIFIVPLISCGSAGVENESKTESVTFNQKIDSTSDVTSEYQHELDNGQNYTIYLNNHFKENINLSVYNQKSELIAQVQIPPKDSSQIKFTTAITDSSVLISWSKHDLVSQETFILNDLPVAITFIGF